MQYQLLPRNLQAPISHQSNYLLEVLFGRRHLPGIDVGLFERGKIELARSSRVTI
jgi:hypothetical protein